ncbi:MULTISPECIES: fimbrial protein [Enterobacter]|jgi:type 1 fimbria pilin|uniref:Fimbriae assembly protein n=1 Tax=Enterobacter bugandensis TaxID=881260 RepID=A0ABX4VGH6_9ENTR|nr:MULTISPECIES: fimbrial protein [Enterobacter]HBM8320081.1 type 1 fimbrial protein [Enterobacter cloacae]ELK6541420.1 type 1 fimbrial protein [Enterobacter bugandensis]MBZ6368797.1 type 1 fimbrial protein [Enterobacter bugandensis]MCK6852385.1 type 1 fimbrial protein [Enterobacter bugandensis]MCK6861893.1 type 1 fimbrial protein [Enterobacter bugandensis]
MMKNTLALLALSMLMNGAAGAADNISFKGTLRAHACTLHPDDQDIQIDFDQLGSRDLYLNGGTADEPFNIRLQNCNIRVASTVEATFVGNQSAKIPGALALDAGSTAAGFAIVLKDAYRQPLKLGDASSSPLTGTDTTLVFYRRLQVDPDALLNNGIVPGTFSASGTFTLFYP